MINNILIDNKQTNTSTNHLPPPPNELKTKTKESITPKRTCKLHQPLFYNFLKSSFFVTFEQM